ncbi:chemotaxis protein CheB [Pseudooctadecabacter sp.]|uniref:chemotaxis protein CheB n=1 Tax=Pseudooctadecabacter sp. TaxID=1966338 RepID=UPI0025F281B0|nr:chemotaxis protein CheB [Pseudooctadecabacter sp.]
MSQTKVIAIIASAGGLRPIHELLRELPRDYPNAVIVASHSAPTSRLFEALDIRREISMNIVRAEDDQRLLPGRIHVVPGARHAFVMGDRISLSDVVKDSGYRPSLDALLMTAAASHGENLTAVVLSGSLKDGMRGTQIVYDTGGTTIVQDPQEAAHASMPNSVIASDHPEEVLSATHLGRWLVGQAELEDGYAIRRRLSVLS